MTGGNTEFLAGDRLSFAQQNARRHLVNGDSHRAHRLSNERCRCPNLIYQRGELQPLMRDSVQLPIPISDSKYIGSPGETAAAITNFKKRNRRDIDDCDWINFESQPVPTWFDWTIDAAGHVASRCQHIGRFERSFRGQCCSLQSRGKTKGTQQIDAGCGIEAPFSVESDKCSVAVVPSG